MGTTFNRYLRNTGFLPVMRVRVCDSHVACMGFGSRSRASGIYIYINKRWSVFRHTQNLRLAKPILAGGGGRSVFLSRTVISIYFLLGAAG